jgi:hypothetical protein
MRGIERYAALSRDALQLFLVVASVLFDALLKHRSTRIRHRDARLSLGHVRIVNLSNRAVFLALGEGEGSLRFEHFIRLKSLCRASTRLAHHGPRARELRRDRGVSAAHAQECTCHRKRADSLICCHIEITPRPC